MNDGLDCYDTTHIAGEVEERDPEAGEKGLPPMGRPFLFRAELSCCTRCLISCLLTLPCFEALIQVARVGELAPQFRVGPYRFGFDGTAGDYCCNVCLYNFGLNFLTFYCWECCGCADRRRNEWIDNHLNYYL